MTTPSPTDKTPPRRTWRQRLRSIAILFLVLTGLPSLLFWFVVAQPILPVRKAASDPSLIVEPAQLEAHVRKLAEDFAPRSYAHLGNLHRAADYIEAQLADTGGRSADQSFIVDSKTYRNVSTHFGPEDGDSPRIVIGAHYDGYSTFPAADDNASGVAVLIELARLAGTRSEAWATPVEFVAYPLEEPPHFATRQMGSAFHAEALKTTGSKVRLMISLEMLGYFSDQRGSQDYPMPFLHLYYPSRGNFVAVIGNRDQRSNTVRIKKSMRAAGPLPVHSIVAPASLPGIDFSDHRNYWDQGFPAVMISDTAFYRNLNYHTADDTPDTLDYDRMAQCTAAIYHALLELDAGN